MDDFLPVWAQPHRFVLLDQRQRSVFTFGLVLTEVHSLGHPEGVRSFARRFGYEWLAGLSAGVQKETGTSLTPSELEVFLHAEHGILGPNALDGMVEVDYDALQEPSDLVVRSFAEAHGALIRRWSLNAFNMLEVKLHGWARARERVEDGHGAAARRRLMRTEMPHALTSVNAIDGSQRWARQYTSLYERVALELEDLAVRRPKPRICPLCNRVYIPLRSGQPTCGNQIWDSLSKELVRRCTPISEAAVYSAAEAAEYRKRRKTRWSAMNRARTKYGHGDPRTEQAINEWEEWRKQNPPPRPPGRPPAATRDAGEPPFHPER